MTDYHYTGNGSRHMHRRWESLEGACLLRDVLERVKQREVAKRLSVSEQAVYFWKIGFHRPESDNRERLDRVYGIPRDAWRTAEQKELDRVA